MVLHIGSFWHNSFFTFSEGKGACSLVGPSLDTSRESLDKSSEERGPLGRRCGGKGTSLRSPTYRGDPGWGDDRVKGERGERRWEGFKGGRRKGTLSRPQEGGQATAGDRRHGRRRRRRRRCRHFQNCPLGRIQGLRQSTQCDRLLVR